MMKRGEIYYADLSPTVGSEINKKRPVLIISNDASNKVSSLITVLPITSNVKKIFPFEVKIMAKESGLSKDSKVQCHQIRAISKLRIKDKVAGFLNEREMLDVEMAVRLHLDFEI